MNTTVLVKVDGARGIVRRAPRAACCKCHARVSAGSARRATGAHVVCPARRGARAVVVEIAPVLFVQAIPVAFRCGCPDEHLVGTDCVCALVTSCEAHGTRHHGTHD